MVSFLDLQETLACADNFVHFCILEHLGAIECRRGILSEPVLLPLIDFCFLYVFHLHTPSLNINNWQAGYCVTILVEVIHRL